MPDIGSDEWKALVEADLIAVTVTVPISKSLIEASKILRENPDLDGEGLVTLWIENMEENEEQWAREEGVPCDPF